MIVSPSSLLRNALITRLSDLSTGFNPTYASAMSQHPGAPAMTINFSQTGNPHNFFLGDVDPESIENTGTFTYPLLTVFSVDGVSQNRQKFQRFAGLARVGARFLLSNGIYKNAQLLSSFEAWPDCVEDAFLQVVQNPNTAVWPATSAYSLLYNGDVSYERRPPFEGGSGWLQILNFKMTFEVVIA